MGKGRENPIKKSVASASLLVLLTALLPLLSIFNSELAAWDEALYVLRAKAVLQFGAFLDQTSYAPGGLYSSSHPPLGVWIMSAFAAIFGEHVWAYRLPGALLGAVDVFLFYSIARRLGTTREAGGVIAATLGLSSIFLFAASRAQLDIYLLSALLLSFLFFAQGIETNRRSNVFLSGFCFGLALLSKLFFGLLLLPLWIVFEWRKQGSVKNSVVVAAMGLSLFVPWLLFMLLRHPDFFSHSLQVVGTAGYEPQRSAAWYYLNQILIAVPILAAAAWGMGANEAKRKAAAIAGAISLLLAFVALNLLSTKMPHYILLLFLPAAVLLAASLDSAFNRQRSRGLLIGLVIAAFAWSSSEQLRMLVRGAEFVLIVPWAKILIACSAGLVGLSLFRRQRTVYVVCFSLLSALLAGRYYDALYAVPILPPTGAPIMAAKLESLNRETVIILHDGGPHEELVPELAYYTNGWTLGWQRGKRAMAVSKDSLRTSNFTIPQNSAAIVIHNYDRFYRPSKEATLLHHQADSIVTVSYLHHLQSRGYSLYY